MQVCLLKSKIHRATITDGNLKYEGSLTIAADLMEKCGLIPYERILCSNMANGNRFEPHPIPADDGGRRRQAHILRTRSNSPKPDPLRDAGRSRSGRKKRCASFTLETDHGRRTRYFSGRAQGTAAFRRIF